jgi:hypothetical protein
VAFAFPVEASAVGTTNVSVWTYVSGGDSGAVTVAGQVTLLPHTMSTTHDPVEHKLQVSPSSDT